MRAVSSNGKFFEVWTNPSLSELSEIGEVVRFTADCRTCNLYVWNFSAGHHADVSSALELEGTFSSLDFLKGAACKGINGTYRMHDSDFLKSFIGRLTGSERKFLTELLNNDWSWVDRYIEVTGKLRSFREALRL